MLFMSKLPEYAQYSENRHGLKMWIERLSAHGQQRQSQEYLKRPEGTRRSRGWGNHREDGAKVQRQTPCDVSTGEAGRERSQEGGRKRS